MPITNAWHTLATEDAPDAAGVYELGNSSDAVVYIGLAPNLKKCIATHRSATGATSIGRNAAKFRTEETLSNISREKDLFQRYKHLHRGAIPTCNTQDPSV